jgi:hypothetical protein
LSESHHPHRSVGSTDRAADERSRAVSIRFLLLTIAPTAGGVVLGYLLGGRLVVLTWLAVNLPRWPRAVRVAGILIVLGATLNGFAIGLNGRMPYEPAAAGSHAGAVTPKNEPADADTRLAVLGDTIAIRPLHAVISLGDLLIGGGTCAFVVFAMRRYRRSGPAPESEVAEEVNHDPCTEPATHRHGDLRAGGAGDPALHDRRTYEHGG